MSLSKTKHEWRKKEKHLYLPKATPELVEVPTHQFLSLHGEGNPNGEPFAECIRALYSLAYGIKMTAKKEEIQLAGHYDYTVYPLEGVWDINDAAKASFTGKINKDDLVFDLMIRQPDFVNQAFFEQILEMVMKRSPSPLLEKVELKKITEGRCIQMLHVGSFDTEPRSFEEMEHFATKQGEQRLSKIHREIYLSDFRRTAEDKLKTVLRFQLMDREFPNSHES